MQWPKKKNLSPKQKVSKFDQIASKFEQIPPKPLDAFHHTVQPELHYITSTTTSSSAQQSTSFTDTAVPNLRIDYFAESKQNDTLDDSQKLTHNNPGAINVTPNPMDTPVCTQPRATIVVQQVRVKIIKEKKSFQKFLFLIFVNIFCLFEQTKKKPFHCRMFTWNFRLHAKVVYSLSPLYHHNNLWL